MNAITIPAEVRELLEAPNYVHLSTLRKDGSPRNHVVWVWVEGDHVIVPAHDWNVKAKDMKRNPRVALSVADLENPYRMAALQGEVVEVRPGDGYELLDRISHKYTSNQYPGPRGGGLAYFVIAITSAYERTLGGFAHNPAETDVRGNLVREG